MLLSLPVSVVSLDLVRHANVLSQCLVPSVTRVTVCLFVRLSETAVTIMSLFLFS